MGTLLGFHAEAVTGDTVEVVWQQYPVKAFIVAPDGTRTGTIGLTDAQGSNLALLAQLAEHGHVVAVNTGTGQTVFDSSAPRLSWPDRPDPITSQLTEGGAP